MKPGDSREEGSIFGYDRRRSIGVGLCVNSKIPVTEMVRDGRRRCKDPVAMMDC